jgi:Family of unknown function (DUF6167)
MARSLWFVAGAGAGIYAMSRARRAVEAVTADGLRDRLSGLGVGMRLFRDEVAAGQAEKETELRERMGLVPHGLPELTGPEAGSARTPTTEQRDTDGHQ